tara:strand:+ start:11556 stop:13448 length:1893 start_codon:yes stop_codon:yes gene_type:complete
MLIYQSTKDGFLSDNRDRIIEDVIAEGYRDRTGRKPSDGEFRSWGASLPYMARVLGDPGIPADVGVAIEYGIPQSSKRIDFLISGRDESDAANLIIVELKQWSAARLSDKDGIVVARRGGRAETEGTHPSYQAWSYAALLRGFNEAVHDPAVGLSPCAYLHNYLDDGVITHSNYQAYLERAPLFLRGDAELRRLREFVSGKLARGDKGRLLIEIENGRIRPSRVLADSLAGMLRGNEEFVLVDDQKVIHENALAAARKATPGQKQVVIIEGGPGTGKSVVAINLLSRLTSDGRLVKYISRNAAPRKVYESKLSGSFRVSEVRGFFGGPNFHEVAPDTYDTLVVDEAHRLNEKSGFYGNLGENQIKELIAASHCSVFFVDDRQMVTLADIGTSAEIESWGRKAGATVSRHVLRSQFRCAGSDDYLAWLDSALGITEVPVDFSPGAFEFQVVDSPIEMHRMIEDRNGNNRARVVAGYCWDWKSKKFPDVPDIVIPEHGYERQWNLTADESLWIIAPHSVEQVGCIHTCQGLEVDYIGVIVGPDLLYRDGRLTTRVEGRSRQDRSVRGWKRLMREDPAGTAERLDRVIRNTYRTLMTRGMKGCFVYCTDAQTQDYFRGLIGSRLRAGASPPAR